MGGYRKRGSSFEINYRDAAGVRHFETIETDDEQIVKGELRKREGDIARGIPITPGVHTLRFMDLAKDVVQDYAINGHSSISDIEARFRLHLLPVFGRRKASMITTADIRSYILSRKEEGAAAGTINRELEAMRRAYLLAIKENRLYARPHIPKLKEENARTGFFEREQLEAIRRHLPDHVADAALCAYITGWRVSEIRSLDVSNVDMNALELRLEPNTTKNREGRIFPFPLKCELRNLLEKRLQLVAELRKRKKLVPYLFWYEIKTPDGKTEIHRLKDFDKSWTTACRKAGLPTELKPLHVALRGPDGQLLRQANGKLILEPAIYKRGKQKGRPIFVTRAVTTFHDFRRTACRNLVRRGIPEKLAMQMIGWKSRAMLDRYHIVAKADLDIARKLMESESVAGTVATAPFQEVTNG